MISKRLIVELVGLLALIFALVTWAGWPAFTTESTEVIDPVVARIEALEDQLATAKADIAELKKGTRPVINVKYGTIIPGDNKVIVEEVEEP